MPLIKSKQPSDRIVLAIFEMLVFSEVEYVVDSDHSQSILGLSYFSGVVQLIGRWRANGHLREDVSIFEFILC